MPDYEQQSTSEENPQELPAGVQDLAEYPDFATFRQQAEQQEQGDDDVVAEEWTDFPDSLDEIDESEPDVDGVPQTMWRGERLYLGNIDQVGQRDITVKDGHEGHHNGGGKTFLARDKCYASRYAVGTDGVTWYDEELPVESIPIGVVYRIKNTGNRIHATPTDREPMAFGPFAGKFREFITEDPIPPEDYEVVELYLMDDFTEPGGYRRSDYRRPLEVYRVKDQSQLPKIVSHIKKRMAELDVERHTPAEAEEDD